MKNKGGRPTNAEVKARKAEQEFRDGLIEQLKNRKADTPFFIEQVDEVIYLRRQLLELKRLIGIDGLMVTEKDRGGHLKVSVNACLREIRETQKSILLIMEKLKVTTDNIISDDEDDEL